MKDQCKQISSSIIHKYFPDQSPIYEIYSDELIDLALDQVDIINTSNEKANFESGDGIIETLELITVIASVAAALLQYVNLSNTLKLSKKERLLKVELKWKDKLTDSGISEEIANSIIKDFSKDIIK